MLLTLKDVTMRFPGVLALDHVTLSVEKGEIHGLCGENGAGKSTLMKILSGVYPSGTFEGEIIYKGKRQSFKNIKEAQGSGIRIIHQEFALVKQLTVAENIFLGCEPRRPWTGVLDSHELFSQARALLQRHGIQLNEFEQVGNLGVGQQQLVEIAKALSAEANVLILDEPTAALTHQEVQCLFSILKRLKSAGVACIYISHKLEEILQITDRVTVLRDGKTISTDMTSQLTENLIVSKMVGRNLEARFPKADIKVQNEVLRVEDLCCYASEYPGSSSAEQSIAKLHAKPKLLDGISFKLHRGEILGVSGLMGSGRTRLARCLFGAVSDGIVQGEVSIYGNKISLESPKQAIANGIAFITEDRKGSGAILEHSILDNISIAQLPSITHNGVIDRFEELKRAKAFFSRLCIKAPGIDSNVGTLSGGNQQKVVLAKWLNIEPRILILDEPTRGIDVGAKFEIYKLIQELASQGMAILMISSELQEILGLCHSVLVMHRGRIAAQLPIREASEEKIMTYAVGLKEQPQLNA